MCYWKFKLERSFFDGRAHGRLACIDIYEDGRDARRGRIERIQEFAFKEDGFSE